MIPVEHASSAGSRPALFQSTLWSQVRMAGRRTAPDAKRALEALCRTYWQPIYAFLRRCGHERQDAKDLTQAFFAYLLEVELLKKASPERGRFRSFLLGSLKFFVSNQRARERALKRGGGVVFVSLDAETEDGCPANEPATSLTPERLFERKWARAVLGEAMDRLEAEYQRAGMADQFAVLQPFLTGDADMRSSELAAHLGKSAGATRVLVCRLRNRFRVIIRGVIAETVSDLSHVESELQQLEAALRDA